MRILHSVGYTPHERFFGNYNTPEEIHESWPEAISFDGVYQNVWVNRDLLQLRGRQVILFVTGDYVGRDNAFDRKVPRETFCTWDQILALVTRYGCEVGWHSWSHANLTKLEDERLSREVAPPFPMKHFAYPYGAFDERVKAAVRAAGFQQAWSVSRGDDSAFERLRTYLSGPRP